MREIIEMAKVKNTNLGSCVPMLTGRKHKCKRLSKFEVLMRCSEDQRGM